MKESSIPRTILVGAGVVGRAILRAHLDAGVPVLLVDQDDASLDLAADQMELDAERWSVTPLARSYGELSIRCIAPVNGVLREPDQTIVVESISERLEIKRAFFADAERWFGDDALLCSNTSTLRISDIAAELNKPDRFCGMHFFMPVYNRPAVEVARGKQTSDETIDRCSQHVRRIGKEPLVVHDGPGFIVNRLLTPYLNEAMLLLCRGVSAARIEREALRYGMPMSPLELIDWIGTRTMFDAGRVFWQSFPTRINPAAMLAALVKNKRFGRACSDGLYDYRGGSRSAELSPAAVEFSERYQRDAMLLSDDDILLLLAIPMWIEAAIARRDGVVRTADELDLAMRGGLGFDPAHSWLAFFDSLGAKTILAAIERWASLTASISAPDELREALEQTTTPSEAMEKFAASAESA